jgi:hypothetical protein
VNADRIAGSERRDRPFDVAGRRPYAIAPSHAIIAP